MDLLETAEDRAFREEARDWLMANVPKRQRPSEPHAEKEFDLEWQRIQYEGGWAGVNWPKEYGGRGLTGVQMMVWLQECSRARAPFYLNRCFIGLYHGGPTLIVRGDEAQKSFHLPKILKGEVTWCQGFSEPGAGSDLAALRTRGEIDGDYLVVNGQKTWTSGAQVSDYQELLIRTDPDKGRHGGMTWVICDMKTPGVVVQPIKTMTGEEEVNNTFYDDVRIPLSNVVGGIGNGWSVAMSTLGFERGTAFIGSQMSLSDKLEDVVALAGRTRLANGRLAIKDDEIRHKLARLKAETTALKAMTLESVSKADKDGAPGAEGSIMRLLVTTLNKQLYRLVAEILGPQLLDYGADENSNEWTYRYMWSMVHTISGGTSQIQREIIADRILGLPRAR